MVSNHDGSIFDIGGNISKVTDTGFWKENRSSPSAAILISAKKTIGSY